MERTSVEGFTDADQSHKERGVKDWSEGFTDAEQSHKERGGVNDWSEEFRC